MPSPVGHALGALAVGWIVSGPATRDVVLKRSAWIVAFGLAPDLDLLIGRHSMETHSFGAALVVAAVAAAARLPLADTRWRIFLAAALAWSTHPILDAYGADGSAPYGVMMFWPVSKAHVMLGALFDPISRRWWLDGFVTHNLLAAVREVYILGPIAAFAWLVMRRRLHREGRPSAAQP